MKEVLILVGFVWLLFVSIGALAMTMISKQSREREEQMDRDEREGEE